MEHERTEPWLQLYISEVMNLESRIADALTQFPGGNRGHSAIAMCFDRLRALGEQHRMTLESHRVLPARDAPVVVSSLTGLAEGHDLRHVASPSGSVGSLYGLLNEAAWAYTALHAAAHRAYDTTAEGNSHDLAEKHLRDYAGAIQGLARLASEVTVWELGELGRECRCQCPSCSLGLCLCSPHGALTAEEVWRETTPVSVAQGDRGLSVRKPRANSAAAKAGFLPGDMIVAVDGREIQDESDESLGIVQETIRKHQSGESVRVRLHRPGQAARETELTRP